MNVLRLLFERRDARKIRPHFDAAFYLRENADVREAGIDPVRHFVRHGWREGRDPRADFSTQGWLADHPELLASGQNPFLHYLSGKGRSAGRKPTAAEIARVIDEAFDPVFYLEHNPDVADAGMDPLRHYIRHGWKEGRNPSAAFSTAYYLGTNPDVRAAGLNPLWHYIVAGRAEGRHPVSPGGEKLEVLSALPTLEEEVAEWKARTPAPDPGDPARLAGAIGAAAAGQGRLVVAISHDDHRRHPGGIQICLRLEERDAEKAGIGFLHLRPHQPLMRLADPDAPDERLLVASIEGKTLGAFDPDDVIAALQGAAEVRSFGIVIHSLLGHAPEVVERLLDLKAFDRCLFWAHDHFAICPGYTLQRNAIAYCGAPDVDSPACGICRYGEERTRHLPRIAQLLERPDVELVAPSRWQADFLAARAPHDPGPIHALPHATLEPFEAHAADRDGPVSVAFCGTTARHKGWSEFLKAAETLRSDPGFRFLYFGLDAVPPFVERHEVDVSDDAPDAMVDALAAAGVDLVMLWAHWPETFSFVAHEAVAAGAAVVTTDISGNVAALVRETTRGAVLDIDTEPAEWLTSEAAGDLIRRVRATPVRAGLSRSRKSLAFLETAEARASA